MFYLISFTSCYLVLNFVFLCVIFIRSIYIFRSRNRVFVVNVRTGDKCVFSERQFKKLKLYYDLLKQDDFILVFNESDFYPDED